MLNQVNQCKRGCGLSVAFGEVCDRCIHSVDNRDLEEIIEELESYLTIQAPSWQTKVYDIIHWKHLLERLCRQVWDIFSSAGETITNTLKTVIEQLKIQLVDARGIWESYLKIRSEVKDNQREVIEHTERELQKMELIAYLSLVKFINISSGSSTSEELIEHDVRIRACDDPDQLFWYRYFGTLQKVDIIHFCTALRLHLSDELKTNAVEGAAILGNKVLCQKIIQNTLDIGGGESDGWITMKEWLTFLQRFGPINSCLSKAMGICTATGELEDWMKPEFDISQAIKWLTENRDRNFVIRADADVPGFVICYGFPSIQQEAIAHGRTGKNISYYFPRQQVGFNEVMGEPTIRQLVSKLAIEEGWTGFTRLV